MKHMQLTSLLVGPVARLPVPVQTPMAATMLRRTTIAFSRCLVSCLTIDGEYDPEDMMRYYVLRLQEVGPPRTPPYQLALS